jgi:hypothetical protein
MVAGSTWRSFHSLCQLGPRCSCVTRESFCGRFREDTRKIISAIVHGISYSIVELNKSMNIAGLSMSHVRRFNSHFQS